MKRPLPYAVLALGLSMYLGCSQPTHTRPTGVPPDAVWAGGVDGGNWITCTIADHPVFNHCIVYHDFTGDVRLAGNFQLADQNRAATGDELVFLYADIIHESIYLKGGKLVLVQHASDPAEAPTR